jgi:enoyl-CoA hydratase
VDARASATPAKDDLLLERRGPVQWVIVNRPSVRNAMTWEMYERLGQVCEEVSADHAVKAMVITGAGGAFVSGADIRQFGPERTEQDVLESQRRLSGVRDLLEQLRVPTIASIAGPCTGGGALLAACCDLRIASPSARFGFPIARTVGNSLSMVEYARVAALLGFRRAKELIMTTRLMNAEEMLAIALVSEVVTSEEELIPRTQALAERLSSYAPLTLFAAKESLRRIRELSVPRDDSNELLLMCYMSEDFREGVDAFLAKRKPVFLGK